MVIGAILERIDTDFYFIRYAFNLYKFSVHNWKLESFSLPDEIALKHVRSSTLIFALHNEARSVSLP
jgi:hypothetical protein